MTPERVGIDLLAALGDPLVLLPGLLIDPNGAAPRRPRLVPLMSRVARLETEQTHVVILGCEATEPGTASHQGTCPRLWPAS
jgi:hypothetical protein